ncbi:MAG: hypothetical protein IKS04_07175 [Clostridia bacterium]|nr:hypothetical protein [Clostridia bacterium]MBR6702140.1 hypothetical protein [Clostridia bacterium]
MKKLAATLICLFLLASLASCLGAEKSGIIGSQEVKAAFADCPHPDTVLKDCANIDFNHRPDFKGLTKKTVKGEDNSPGPENWYDRRGNLIYSVYDKMDFAEGRFDYYTKTKSGKKITVAYCLNGEETFWIKADGENYSVHFSEFEGDIAGDIYIEEFKPGNIEYISYSKSGDKWVTGDSVYFTQEGLIHYYGCSADGKEDYGTDILAEKAEKVAVSEITDEFRYAAPLQCGARSCRFSYTDSHGGREWFLTAPFIYQFDDIGTAERFSQEFGQPEPEYSPLDGETPQVTTGEFTLKVSEKFALSDEFKGFLTAEINDNYSIILTLDDNKEITGFEPGFIQFY